MLLIPCRLKVRIYYITYLSLHNKWTRNTWAMLLPSGDESLCAGGMTHRFPPCSGHPRWPVQCSLVPNSKFCPLQIKFFGIDEVVPASETSIKKVPATLKRLVNYLRQQNINTYMYYTTNISKVNNDIFSVAICLLYIYLRIKHLRAYA